MRTWTYIGAQHCLVKQLTPLQVLLHTVSDKLYSTWEKRASQSTHVRYRLTHAGQLVSFAWAIHQLVWMVVQTYGVSLCSTFSYHSVNFLLLNLNWGRDVVRPPWTWCGYAGWSMPVQYSDLSIANSCLHTRSRASIFDVVSHMLQVQLYH